MSGYKAGDKVRIIKNNEGEIPVGTIGVVKEVQDLDALHLEDEDDHYNIRVETEDNYEYFAENELAHVGRGRPRTKPKPVKFLLKYDLDEDPIEEFSTMDEVKERIDYLIQHERSLKRDSMIVYEIKSKKIVSVSTKIKLSK